MAQRPVIFVDLHERRIILAADVLGALAAFGAMTIVFLGAIGSAWWRGLDITCGCFGNEVNRTNFPLHIGGNLLMLTGVVILWFVESRRSRATAKLL